MYLSVYAHMRACSCVRACMCASVRVCICACVYVHIFISDSTAKCVCSASTDAKIRDCDDGELDVIHGYWLGELRLK